MTFIQAVLIGLFAYLGSKRTPWVFGVTGGWNMLGRPLVAGLVCGIILNDVKGGVIAGAMVQALFLGQITPGGAMPADVNWASYLGIPLALAAHGSADQAVALAVPLSLLGVALFNFIMTFNAIFPHMGDKAAAKGDGAGIERATLLTVVPSFLLRGVMTMFICYFGAPLAEAILKSMPAGVLHFFAVAGRLLPAFGFAMLLKQSLIKEWMIVLFLMGWVLSSATGMTITSLAILSVGIAFLFVMAQENQTIVKTESATLTEEDNNYED